MYLAVDMARNTKNNDAPTTNIRWDGFSVSCPQSDSNWPGFDSGVKQHRLVTKEAGNRARWRKWPKQCQNGADTFLAKQGDTDRLDMLPVTVSQLAYMPPVNLRKVLTIKLRGGVLPPITVDWRHTSTSKSIFPSYLNTTAITPVS